MNATLPADSRLSPSRMRKRFERTGPIGSRIRSISSDRRPNRMFTRAKPDWKQTEALGCHAKRDRNPLAKHSPLITLNAGPTLAEAANTTENDYPRFRWFMTLTYAQPPPTARPVDQPPVRSRHPEQKLRPGRRTNGQSSTQLLRV